MLKINCFLYTARVQDCKQWEAYLSMWESRKQLYLPLIKPTKTQYKEGGRRIRPARYTCRAINTTYSSNPSVLEIIELAIIIHKKEKHTTQCLNCRKCLFFSVVQMIITIITICLLYLEFRLQFLSLPLFFLCVCWWKVGKKGGREGRRRVGWGGGGGVGGCL